MKKFARKFVPALLILSLAAAVHAEAPAPAARLSIASIDQVSKAMADMGLPKFDITKNVETLFALGDGSIDTSKPGGVLVLAGDALPPITGPGAPQLAILAIPVKEGKVTPDTLKAAGAITVDDKPGIFKLSKFYYRRLGSYVLIQTDSTLGLAELKDVPFANDYKTAGNLAVFTFDMAAVRKLAPDGYKMVKDMANGMNTPVPLKLGTELGAVSDKLDKFTLAVAEDDKNLHLKTWITPFGPDGPAPKAVARPNFPKGMLAQVHVVYPSGDSTALFKGLFDAIPAEAFGGMDKAHIDNAKALALRAGKLFGGSTGVSLAVGMKGGAPVVFIVPQFAANVDYDAEVKAILDAGKNLDPNDKGPQPVASVYDSAGKKVTRVTIPNDGGIIDCIPAGKTLYLTVSPRDGKYVSELADGGLSATTSTLICAGVLNLGAIFDSAVQQGAVPLAPDQQADIKKTLDGQAITWTVQGADGKTLYADLAVPKQVLGKATEMFFTANQGTTVTHPMPDGVDTMPPPPPAAR